MSDIYVAYNCNYVSGGEVCAGDEDSDWPNYETAYYDFELLGVFAKDPKGYLSRDKFTANIDVGSIAYVVVVRYGDGDTFSHNSGKGGVAGVYATEKEAQDLAKAIKDDTFKGYKFWDDYFGGLESVKIMTETVKEQM